MPKSFLINPNPHIHSGRTTQKIMADVLIALVPCVLAATILFGWRALALVAFCVAVCVATEWLAEKLFKKPSTISDLSAAVTGVILACNLPSTMPFWMAAIGCVVAIFFAKQVFGGIGSNTANPAIVGRIVLMLSFASAMSNFVKPNFAMDGVASATLLPQMIGGVTTGTEQTALPSLTEVFLGLRAGCLGETCILAICLGFVYLVIRRVIHLGAPLAFVLGYAGLTWLVTGDLQQVLYGLMGGGLLFGAVFMATDYPTTPRTGFGRVIFGLGCALVTFGIRYYGNLPEGVSFGILLMNMLTPLIDRFVKPHPFGLTKKRPAKGEVK